MIRAQVLHPKSLPCHQRSQTGGLWATSFDTMPAWPRGNPQERVAAGMERRSGAIVQRPAGREV